MNIEDWEKLVKQTYFHALDAAKEVEPNTPEWELVWSVLNNAKDYYEAKHEQKNEPM